MKRGGPHPRSSVPRLRPSNRRRAEGIIWTTASKNRSHSHKRISSSSSKESQKITAQSFIFLNKRGVVVAFVHNYLFFFLRIELFSSCGSSSSACPLGGWERSELCSSNDGRTAWLLNQSFCFIFNLSIWTPAHLKGEILWTTLGYLSARAKNGLRTNRVTRDRCYDFLNIFAEKYREKIGVFDSKQS
jgi:hypothetical protein